MVVDIIDVDFETLHFNKRYDQRRYIRGKDIYREGRVQIEEVNQLKDNCYKIEAYVEGNYDNYNTELKIDGELITDYSCTCEDFYKGNLCKHILATSMEAISPHYASTEEGRKKLKEKKKEEAKRHLENLRKRQEEERKRFEYERKYYTGLNAIENYKEKYQNNNPKTLDLREIFYEAYDEKHKRTANLATSVKLEYTIEIASAKTLKISLKIGQTRMYILNNIPNFYKAYKNKEELFYGKQLSLIPQKEIFTKDSQDILELLLNYAEILDYNQKYARYSLDGDFNRAIYLDGEKIDEFFNLNKNKTILVNESNMPREYRLTDKKLDIKCILSREKVQIPKYSFWSDETSYESEEYVLKLNIEDFDVLFSKEKIYIFYKNEIYVQNKDKNIVELFKLFRATNKILIPEDKLEEFKETVLSHLKCFETNNLPEKIEKEVLVVDKLGSKILLDTDDNGNILLELKFCYKDYEINVLDKNSIKNKEIVRDIPSETEVVKRLFMDGFEIINGRKDFIMKNPDDMYDFLQYKIEDYMNDYEVLATDRFKNKQIKQPKISNIGIRIDNGLLEIDFSKINIDINEIKDILKDYQIKKKYHKLKNGDLVDLSNNESLDLLDEMATTLDIDYGKISKGKIDLPVNRSLYLEKLIVSNKEINVSKNEEYTSLIDNLENTNIDDIKLDDEFEKNLREYQKVGYKWLKTLSNYKFGGILADDMGLGKTLQIIALLKSELQNKNTSIVVCPSTLVLNWKSEVEKWCNNIKVLIIRGSADERKEKLNKYQDYDLLITSYDLLKRDIENYEDLKFKYVIADEAQYIKNATTQNATSLKHLIGEVKFALTGTPIENSIAELWSIFDFIMPGYLYNYNKFKKKFEEPILKNEDKEALERLKKLISPFVLRRIKKDVLTELPEKNITIMENEMTEEQQKIYLSYLAQTKKEVAEELNGSSFEKSKFKILMLLTRLRQICCHPSLFIENYNGGSGKLEQCINLTKEAIDSGHKILIFSSYTSMFEIIEKELGKLNINYFKLVGDTPVSKRIEMVEEFNNTPEIKVFLISLKAGGTGLNLTSADVVIHYDPWWNISSENQATDRAYRIGQKNSVQVYKLITSNSIEEKINKMQERKEKLSKDILSTEETFISKMSKEEILNLFE